MAYEDIMDRERPEHSDDPFSFRHPKMARVNRAKLFAPFAALAGFDAAVRAKEIPYEEKRVPDAEEVRELNRQLNALSDIAFRRKLARLDAPVVRVEYFVVCSDKNHEAFQRLGTYRTEIGRVKEIDVIQQTLAIGDRRIPFGDILTLDILPNQFFRRANA